MAQQQLDTLSFDNCTLGCFYDSETGLVTAVQLDPAEGVVPVGTPTRSFQAGDVIVQRREGQDRVTLTAIANQPYATRSVEANFYSASCDIAISVSPSNTIQGLVDLTVTTSFPPFYTKLNSTANFTEGKTRYEGVPLGAGMAYATDANDCLVEQAFFVSGTSTTVGVLKDTFTDNRGVIHSLYYDQTRPLGQQIVDVLSPATAGQIASVTTAERGYIAGQEVSYVCEGTTRVSFQASLGNPFLQVVRTVNSADCPLVPALQLTATATHATATSANGSVTVTSDGGSGRLTLRLLELSRELTPTRGQATDLADIPPGTYTLRLTDEAGQLREETITVNPYVVAPRRGCTDSTATNYDSQATVEDGSCVYEPQAREPEFFFPLASSLRIITPGGESFDNTLLGDENPLNYYNPGYCQLVRPSDTLVLQFFTNYQSVAVELRRCADNQTVQSFTAVRVLTGQGQQATVSGYLRADTSPSQSRIYFNSDSLPVPFQPGDRVTLTSAGTLSGTYPILQVLEDATAAVPYLVIGIPFPQGQQRQDATITTAFQLAITDTWQVVVPFSAIEEGCYTLHFTATDPEFEDRQAVSEPIEVGDHPHSVLLTYRNFDNAFGVNYTLGLVHRRRVTASFFDRGNETEKKLLRQSSDQLTLLSAKLRRVIRLRVFLVPDYIHEQIALAFCHDFVRVDTLEIIGAESYEREPVPGYTLSNGSIVLEQAGLFGPGNGDDLGDVDAGDYLLINGSRLLINT